MGTVEHSCFSYLTPISPLRQYKELYSRALSQTGHDVSQRFKLGQLDFLSLIFEDLQGVSVFHVKMSKKEKA